MQNSTLPTIEIDALLAGQWDQYRSLLTLCYPRLANVGGQILDQQALLDHLERADGKLLAKMPESYSLNPHNYSILAFIDQLYELYRHNCQLHTDIKELLGRLRPALARALLQQTLPWQLQPLQAAFATIYSGALGWQQNLGRAGQRYIDRLTALVDEHRNSAPEHLLKALSTLNSAEMSRIAKLESRLRDAEIGQLHAKHAQQLCTKTLNQQMAGKKLPAVISTFLQGPWRESMRLTAVNKGKESEQWQQIIRLTQSLIQTFQPFDSNSPEQRQQIVDAISDLSEQLRDVAVGLHHRDDIDRQLELVEMQHLLILKAQPLNYSPFELIDNSNPLLSSSATISKTLLKRVMELKEGQWFIHHSELGDQRIKLCLKISAVKQLLFTNFLGIKVAQKSFEEFAFLLSSKIVIPLQEDDPLTACGEEITGTLFASYRLQIEQVSVAAAAQKQQIEQRQRDRETERKKLLMEAVAARQARSATLASADTVVEAAVLNPAQAAIAPQQGTSTTSAELHVGAKINFGNADDNRQHYRLAAIIKSSKLHIFVDRAGIKQYSLLATELDEQFAGGTAQLIDPGSSFEGSLEKVVNNLRDRKSL